MFLSQMPKILFVQAGSGFRNPNKHLLSHLKELYPKHEIEVIDVLELVKRNYLVMAINGFHMLYEYFFDLITRRKSLRKYKAHLLGTNYLFSVFSRIIQRKIENEDYHFILQTQCLCNPSNIKGIPYFIYTDHTNLNNLNYSHIKQTEYLHSDSYIKLEKQAYENATLIFVMSPNIKESLVKQYFIDEHRIKLVYVGTNTRSPDHVNLAKYQNKNILFVGKDWKRKGGPLLLEAFKLVQKQIPEATLTILGCKPSIRVKNCFAYGVVSLQEVEKIYNQTTLFCMPTLREPFGIVFLEAMFNCLPVVTNNVGATPYLIRNGFNGYIVDYTKDALAKVLVSMLNNPEKCLEMGNNAYTSVRENYTWENVSNLMNNYIKDSLPEPSTHSEVMK